MSICGRFDPRRCRGDRGRDTTAPRVPRPRARSCPSWLSIRTAPSHPLPPRRGDSHSARQPSGTPGRLRSPGALRWSEVYSKEALRRRRRTHSQYDMLVALHCGRRCCCRYNDILEAGCGGFSFPQMNQLEQASVQCCVEVSLTGAIVNKKCWQICLPLDGQVHRCEIKGNNLQRVECRS